ncbi:acyl-CoA dehydrogenase family protein [Streptomyces sp. NPDC098781]|uniref:acyl-CoA dehydrogenase family protein n=1 Tax=Streptomyces sp. NPDC098781 TaxID=3366097 RepID=UPI0038141329
MTIAPPAPTSLFGDPGRGDDAPSADGPVDWPHIAAELADDLATDAVEREQAGQTPYDEVTRLRESGLLTLLVPARRGGGGAGWRTAYTVVRTVAAADGSVGQLLGSHYFLSYCARFFGGPDRAARIERASAAGEWCWGGGIASHEPPLMLTPTANGYLLDGHQRCGSGVGVADRLLVRAAVPGAGEPLAVLVDPAHPGLVSSPGGDTFGRRLTGAGSVACDSVPVGHDDVLGSLSSDVGALTPLAGLAVPTARLVSAQFCLGIAEGLLGEVREQGRAVPDGWDVYARDQYAQDTYAQDDTYTQDSYAQDPYARDPHVRDPYVRDPYVRDPYVRDAYVRDSYARDPYVLTAYGELTVAARAASALADQAVDALTGGLARGEDLDDEECAEITVLASAAEAAAARAAQEITTRALDAVGASAAHTRHGLDRFWRDTRAHTLREPVAHRLREVGDYFLNGAHPPFSLPA